MSVCFSPSFALQRRNHTNGPEKRCNADELSTQPAYHALVRCERVASHLSIPQVRLLVVGLALQAAER
ncbi:hypothetical protein TgHK011_000570 [Trichoderma gracile]|nr:hypothetical protein TgHK011_000570 [Trichoderma gracile]